MDTSWWPLVAVVVLLALVATLVDGWGRGRRGRRRARQGSSRPQPAEIWWARVPSTEGGEPLGPVDAAGTRGHDRPCLVLSVRGRHAVVAEITSTYRDERAGVIPLPPGSVGGAQGRASYLETDELRDVPVRDFSRRVGVMDPVLWDQVRHLAT
ncbi:type II toxin-antitoxin system PemK/MazF family toxin [Streptomyces sp. DH24]|uniref:type II toxin-antitoxin system PemK/MazF family toxin n=1 Tax=Streptomyces sp. DH24 TaxID=3040123 RepID=UPI002441A2A8|nr:type II toxin-antitoxin system PemK/MazF family toxin [Streptomyces sp. DH24]MDG9720370.1 type II toxin-antitoxin system PemK/MazF family toxin [Streptomyces sp. DH24]